MAVSSVANAAANAALAGSQAGITAKGRAFLDKARDMLVDNQDKYSMIDKVRIYQDMGDAWMDRGWFNDAEKKVAQQIIEASAATGPNGFMQKVWKFEGDKGTWLQTQGPFPDQVAVLAKYKAYEPWQQELIKQEILSVEIQAIFNEKLKARDGKNGFVFARDASFDAAGIKDPIARQLLQLMKEHMDAMNIGTWRDRVSTQEKFLEILKGTRSDPVDRIDLSAQAQAYLGARQAGAR
jgi:hypothetical protein